MGIANNVLDGIGFAANSAISLGKGIKAEISECVQDKVQEFMSHQNYVTRAEYDELREMVEKLRAEQEDHNKK